MFNTTKRSTEEKVLDIAGVPYATASHVAVGVIVALLAGVELWFIHDRPVRAA